jgi:rhodanese-related sulfurtransferase
MAEVLVVNVLAPQYYEDCHITDSINVPFEQLESFARTVPKETPIVVYCARYECHASEQAYRDLLRMGFMQVYEYPGGMAEWYQKGYPTTGPAKEKYLHDSTRPHAGPADVKIVTAEHLKKMMTNHS